MIDLRIVALGAMALLIAAYGASTVGGSFQPETTTAMQARVVNGDGDRTGSIKKHDRGVHIDGFDLRH